jgi:glycosyltransferase involved in cell wall biosynthesis
MMKILIAAATPRRREGGVAGVVTSYAQSLEKRGHAVTCVFLEDLLPEPRRYLRFSELQFAARLLRYIAARRSEFSVVNLHAPAGVLYGLRRRFLGAAGPPYVMTLHGLEENRIYAMEREARKGRARNFAWKNRAWHRLYHQPRFDWAIRTADAAHCFSRDVWTVLRLKYDLDDERVAYIPNGVSQRFFLERDYRNAPPLRLLYAGTWLDQRGIYYLREALPRVFSERPEMRFTFAGPGIPAAEIRTFFGEALAARLDIVDTVPWEKMPHLYAGHDILVLPSLVEGQPSVILEAMASGMPVVTAETCGMVDLIENGCDGCLVPPADSPALVQALLQLSSSSELRERLGRAAQARMRRHTWEGAASRFEELLECTVSRAEKE